MVIRGGMLLLSGLADLGNDPGLVRLGVRLGFLVCGLGLAVVELSEGLEWGSWGEVLAGLAVAGFFAVNLLLFLLRERRGRPE